MSKNKITSVTKTKKINFEKEIMSKVKSGKITMKPKWYFVVGSLFSIVGLSALSVMSVFMVNILIFLLRRHGPMAQWRLEVMLNSFSIWIPVIAIFGIVVGIWLLKKYDFAYKRNFPVIIFGFIMSIVIAGFVIDGLGLNDIWSRRGLMKNFYQKIEKQDRVPVKGVFQDGRGGVNFKN